MQHSLEPGETVRVIVGDTISIPAAGIVLEFTECGQVREGSGPLRTTADLKLIQASEPE